MTSFSEPFFWATRPAGRWPLHPVSVVFTEPAMEPVSLTEVKNRLRIIPSATAEDADLIGLMLAARRQVEKDLGEACLVSTVVDHYVDRVPSDRILTLPRWPLQSVASVKSYDLDDVETTFSSGDYRVDTASRPGRVLLNGDASWPSSLRYQQGLIVRHTSGFSGATKTVSSITRASAVATFTTSAAHGWASGQRVTFAGADQADYNGTFEITATGAATGTFAVSGTPASPATGTMTAANLGIPALYTLAMMTLIAHWYVHREAVMETTSLLPLAYETLLSDAPVSLC